MLALVYSCGMFCGAQGAQASGFAIVEQSVRGLGTAYAGSAAMAEDASTLFYNPAGLARLSGHRLEVGAHFIMPSAKFEDRGSTNVLGQSLNVHDNEGGDAGVNALVPNLYYAHSLSENFKMGIGVFTPFGLKSEYDRNWVGRYYAVESDLQTININPSAAFRISRQWSIGGGVSFQYAEATLSNKADFGLAIGQSQQHDGFGEMTGDGWGYGFNLGVLFEPTESSRIGLAFRSKIHHKLKGDIDYTYDDATARAIATAGDYVNADASSEVDLPETVSLGIYHAFNAKLALLAGATWTNWSRFNELRVQYDSRQPDTVMTLAWDDTWRFDLGLVYQFTGRVTGRFGVAYDMTPIPDAAHRTPRIPDEDRYWVALGGGYKLSDRVGINFAYLHIFVDDPKVDKQAVGEDLSRGALVGQWDASVDVISLNLAYTF